MRQMHGLYSDSSGKKNRLYHIWEDMKNRCYNSNNRRYKDYGGRGISVCGEWKNNYLAFHEWAMSNGYASNLTIDRKDVDGIYCPGNCKWATQKEQGNNRRNNRFIEWQGQRKTIMQWGAELGIQHHVLRNRLKRGWTIERMLTTPTEKHNQRAA